MPKIEVSKPAQLSNNLPDKPLSDATVLAEPLRASIEHSLSPELAGVSFALSAGASVTIEGFNAVTDRDGDGVLGAPGHTVGEDELRAQLTLGERAWLKYKMDARVKAGVNADLSFLATDVEGELTVGLLDYHAHELTENVRKALLKDAQDLRAAVRAEDLDRLQVHDAMALQVRGNLRASVELSWSDIFTTNLNRLTALLQSSELLALKTRLGATLTASVKLTDDFVIVFTRPSATSINVGLRKAKSRGVDISAGLGLDVEFADSELVEKVLQGALEAFAGVSLPEVDELIARLSTGGLDVQLSPKLDALLSRLGLDQYKNDPIGLTAEWNKLREDLVGTLRAIAKSKITAGVTYEYLRLSTETNLLEVNLSNTDARLLHPHFIKGDLTRVLDWMRSNGKEPVRYFNQRTLKASSALGFSLGFNDWSIRGKHARSLEVVTQENFQKQLRVAYHGIRSYEGKLFELEKTVFSADLKADTSSFLDRPRAVDLNYGLHLAMGHTHGSQSAKELRRVVDEAIVWRIIDEAQEEQVLQQIRDAQGTGKKVETRLELKLGNARFRELLPLIARANPADFAFALARSMPWETMKARSIVDLREQAYAPAWLQYLKNPRMSFDQAVAYVVQALRQNPNSNDHVLISNEKRPGTGIWSFAELIRAQTDTASRWQSFTEGANHLQQAFTNGASHTEVRTTFKKMEELWKVAFQMKALGAYLTRLALQTPAQLSGIERTFTVRILDNDQQIIFSTSR